MNDQSNNPTTPPSVEEGAKALIRQARHNLHQRHQNCENNIRQSPTTAVLIAVAVGYFLHLLPIRAILVTKVRVISALAPPALFIFGAAKLVEFLQRQKTNV